MGPDSVLLIVDLDKHYDSADESDDYDHQIFLLLWNLINRLGNRIGP